ncbi:MAG: hypothetical protein IPK39_05005 [Sulfuritalea sp.]|nr:hypothetical protein [Sulfuritalea sp.]
MGVTTALVIDPRGRVLAASDARRTGRDVTPDFLAHIAPVIKGSSGFVRPHRDFDAAAGARELGPSWVAAPIRAANGKVVAVLALGSPAEKGFSGLSRRPAPATAAAKPWPSTTRAGCCRPAAMPKNCGSAA